MVKAEITKKDGTHITVEGSEEEVTKIISSISESPLPEPHPAKREKEKKVNSSSKLSISDMIDELKEEGFFNKPQGLLDLKSALEQRGHIYPVTTLSGKVVEKVRKRELGRIKEDKKWKYVKR
jgi:hypothetical protein